MMRCIKFLYQNEGTPYEALEVAEALGLPKDSVRRDLRRAATEGLVNSGKSTQNKRALVYYVGVRKQALFSARSDQHERSDQTDHISLITSSSAQPQDSGRCDQVISKSLPSSCREENQKARSLDHLITSDASYPPQSIDSKANKQNEEVITSLITEAIAPEKSDQCPPSERSPVTSLNEEVLTEVGEEVGKNDDTQKSSALPGSSSETAIDGGLAVGSEVKVLAGSTKYLQNFVGKVLSIGTIDNGALWLKEGKGFNYKLVGPYQAHQVRRNSQ
jgi:DNA-binding MarR family transcriptional regulator